MKLCLRVAVLLLVAGCTTQSTVETKLPDQAAKSDALYRAQIHTQRAAEYYQLGRFPVALEAAKQAVAALPTHAPAYNMLGIVQMELGQDNEARAAYEQALKISPGDSETLNNYGWFVCRQDPKSAMQYFVTALKNPVYATPERALYNQAVCARKMGDNALAEASLRETLRRNPQFSPAMLQLAEMQFSRGEVKAAEAMLARHNEMVSQPSLEALWLGVRVARTLRDKTAEGSYIQQLNRRFPDAKETRLAMERNQ